MQSLRPIIPKGNPFRNFSSSNKLALIQKWRQERGLPLNPNATGVLTDGPDYTFLDGRITPFGQRQKARIMKQEEIKKNIIQLTAEIDFAVERHKKLLEEEKNKKNEILSRKLKPKGELLLKSKTNITKTK